MSSFPIRARLQTFWVAIIILRLSIVVVVSAATNKQCSFDSLRLPERVKPTHYDLLLKLSDVSSLTYEGQVKINVTIGELDPSCSSEAFDCSLKKMFCKKTLPFGCNQKEIVLNANSRVTIQDAQFVVEKDGQMYKTMKSDEICRDTQSEMAAIRFNKRIKDNSRGQLIINFKAQAGADETSDGIYKSTWKDPGGKSRSHVSLVSQFEPASARKALPCFDEPALKSTFDVTIEHRKDLTALANTMPVREEPVKVGNSANLVRTYFDRTPIVSTYLLAFGVGEYEHLESRIMDEKMLMRVFTPPGHQEMGRIGLDIGRRAYAALHEYFDIEQPLEKIDFLPVKMAFGKAMENWGLVTFKDDVLLVDGDQAKDIPNLSYLTVVVSHELAHHWFGNLVTMKWWDNLWLNEAFAQWLGYVIADEIHPEFNVKITMVECLIMAGLEADADPDSTHPIKNPKLKSIKDIQDSFDRITYYKGGAILRMLEGYVGHETFKLAIRDYLNEFKYRNTDENDLWNALQARSGLQVPRMMGNWLNQASFPLLTVQFASSTNKISVKQERFGQSPSGASSKQLWIIPIKILVVRGDQPGVDESQVITFVMRYQQETIKLPDWFDPSKGHWFKFNHDAEGFFRVQYYPEVRKMMRNAIKTKQMSLLDRMNVVDDIKALCKIKKVGLDTVDDMLTLFEGEEHPSLMLHLAGLVNMIGLSNDSSSNRHKVLVDYFNMVIMRDTKKLWDTTIQDGVVKRATLSALILARYEPAIEFGLQNLAEMSEEERSAWPRLEEALNKRQTHKQ